MSIAKTRKVIGKAQARDQFPSLVDAVAAEDEPVEITDYGKTVAVLISAKHYAWLASRAPVDPGSEFQLCGSLTVLGDLEEGSSQLSSLFTESLKKTISEL